MFVIRMLILALLISIVVPIICYREKLLAPLPVPLYVAGKPAAACVIDARELIVSIPDFDNAYIDEPLPNYFWTEDHINLARDRVAQVEEVAENVRSASSPKAIRELGGQLIVQGDRAAFERAYSRVRQLIVRHRILTVARPVFFLFPLLAMSFVLGNAALQTRIKRSRRKRGLCENCRYDLRASPSRCPECGHVQSIVRRSTLPATSIASSFH